MSEKKQTKNDEAWEKLFKKHRILEIINSTGEFMISSKAIKEFREPRLMAKADNYVNLPDIFKTNQLAMLPVSISEYRISNMKVFQEIKPVEGEIKQLPLPEYLKSLTNKSVDSETVSINSAIAAGVFEDFLEEEGLFSTVSGRMRSGQFKFSIQDNKRANFQEISVNNSQIEIDVALEGFNSLTLVEAKNHTAPDFLVRQLYYPYRKWSQELDKNVRMLFLVFSNDVFSLYEYRFEDPNNYNSIMLSKSRKYSIEERRITLEEVVDLSNNVSMVSEPEVPFPQADDFEKVIDLSKNLVDESKDLETIALDYAFDIRQAAYYSSAGIYLGLITKHNEADSTMFTASDLGKKIDRLNYKEKQLEICKLILEHKVFFDVFKLWLTVYPTNQQVVEIMKNNYVFNIQSDETYRRRAQTVISWIGWIFGLTEA